MINKKVEKMAYYSSVNDNLYNNCMKIEYLPTIPGFETKT